jgi:putative transcriptional regulator
MPEEFRSLKGQLLLDGGQLRGSIFHRSVVLVCHHDADGAFGLVLTQPTAKKVGEVILEDLPPAVKEELLYVGGPVQADALTFLHSDAYLPDANVMANLRMGHSLEELQALGEGYSVSRRLRCYAGYAGWSAGQLDEEMKRKAWLLHPATLELVFTSTPGDLWKSILRSKGWKHRLLAESPEDPASN